jgi:hypothetical protein
LCEPGPGIWPCGRPNATAVGRGRPRPRPKLIVRRRRDKFKVRQPTRLRGREPDTFGDGAWRTPLKGRCGVCAPPLGERGGAPTPPRSCPHRGRARMTKGGQLSGIRTLRSDPPTRNPPRVSRWGCEVLCSLRQWNQGRDQQACSPFGCFGLVSARLGPSAGNRFPGGRGRQAADASRPAPAFNKSSPDAQRGRFYRRS